ncbi:MAG: Eco57I restriction-modification methylase domain-containing protein [Acidobacteria bacterium]|nr:Eco57I restriction-modification methylase domain-containing protein [Acidobacteriota bacterium]
MADAMVGYVTGGGACSIFDPAVGAGAFFLAARRVAPPELELRGTEIDPSALQGARDSGLSASDLSLVEIRDFVLDPPTGRQPAIVANPPYIRHHRLSAATKGLLREFGRRLIGTPIDGRAGLHVYFLLRALELLDHGGRLAFIMPADTVEGVFARALWQWISHHFRVDAVVTFSHQATPFPGVDTNALVFMISANAPIDDLAWGYCDVWGTNELRTWVESEFTHNTRDVKVERRSLAEAMETGLSRPPQPLLDPLTPRLGNCATVLRGIATGANEFFFLTRRRAREVGIPSDLLVPAIGRTRDAPEAEVSAEHLDVLEANNRPNVLFSPDARRLEQFPEAVQEYLGAGLAMGLSKRALIASRRPWYRMETRKPPPFLFAYLGRRNARFIRNRARVVPLTGFLCVYPRDPSPEAEEALWRVLSDPRTVANLRIVGKSYGSGAIKVEPRALERLPLPSPLVREPGIARVLDKSAESAER